MLEVLGDALSVDVKCFSSSVLEMKQTPSVLIVPKFPVSSSAVPSPQEGSSALTGKVCDRAHLLGLCWVLAWG